MIKTPVIYQLLSNAVSNVSVPFRYETSEICATGVAAGPAAYATLPTLAGYPWKSDNNVKSVPTRVFDADA